MQLFCKIIMNNENDFNDMKIKNRHVRFDTINVYFFELLLMHRIFYIC